MDRLEADRRFCRHGMQHLIDTARLAYLFALESSADLPKDVIYAAALLHDIGRAEQYRNGTPHDVAGCAAAEPILAECGFAEEERDMILTAIGSHRKEKSRVSGRSREQGRRSRTDRGRIRHTKESDVERSPGGDSLPCGQEKSALLSLQRGSGV